MELSLSGFLFEEEYRSQSLEFAEFCELAQRAGYDGVELRRTQVDPRASVSQRSAMRRSVGNHGLRVTCLTARGMPAGGDERDTFFASYLELCADLGCRLLKIGGEPEWLCGAAEMAGEQGVTLASNNHVGNPLETVEGTRALLAAVSHPGYGLLYDALHLNLSAQDYVGCIPELSARTENVLVHSMRKGRHGDTPDIERDGQGWVKCLPDDGGAQDWHAVLATFRRSGYDGPVTVIESGWPEAEREHVARHCAAVLRRMWDAALASGEDDVP